MHQVDPLEFVPFSTVVATPTITAQNLNIMSKPTLDGIKQASFGALDKAKLMVGLKNADQIEEESQSERSNSFVESAADLLCPELTFQQRLIGFGACFTLGCKFERTDFWCAPSCFRMF